MIEVNINNSNDKNDDCYHKSDDVTNDSGKYDKCNDGNNDNNRNWNDKTTNFSNDILP